MRFTFGRLLLNMQNNNILVTKESECEMIIPAKQAIQEIADLINKELAEMPDDETRQAVLDAFSKQMFCDTRREKEK